MRIDLAILSAVLWIVVALVSWHDTGRSLLTAIATMNAITQVFAAVRRTE